MKSLGDETTKASFTNPDLTSNDLPPEWSEEALALRFSAQYENDLRYVAEWGKWILWDTIAWSEDKTLAVSDRIRAMCRKESAIYNRKDNERRAGRLASAATVTAVERLAKTDRRHAATCEQWDSDLWLLNTPSGTVHLLTGALGEHKREDYLTKSTTVAPGGRCDLWRRFLAEVTNGDADLQGFLQRLVGYCLTGCTREQAILFFYGTGANGKSVFLSAIAAILGDYAKTAPASAFTATNSEQHPTDLAGLRGARFVTAIETDEGHRWAEAKIKSLTGGDPIVARFMRQDFFQYVPQFKLVIAGNHKPVFRNVDEAIRRRLHLVPFSHTVPESLRDPHLPQKLQSEYPGILKWAIEGCLLWQKIGLNPPDVVRKATAEYLAEEDLLGRWREERCVNAAGSWSSAKALYSDWHMWALQAGEQPGSQKRFSQALVARGIQRDRTAGARGFCGIALRE